jgi:hypothetical protein
MSKPINPKILNPCTVTLLFLPSVFLFFFLLRRPSKLVQLPYAAAIRGRCSAATATQKGRRLPEARRPLRAGRQLQCREEAAGITQKWHRPRRGLVPTVCGENPLSLMWVFAANRGDEDRPGLRKKVCQ